MGSRKCIFTGKDSNTKTKILEGEAQGEEKFNWTLNVPTCLEYKERKGEGMASDLEIDIHETFYLLELARMRVKHLENKLESLQAKNNQTEEEKPSKKSIHKKDRQIKQAIHEKEVVQATEEKLEKVLEKRSSKMWE